MGNINAEVGLHMAVGAEERRRLFDELRARLAGGVLFVAVVERRDLELKHFGHLGRACPPSLVRTRLGVRAVPAWEGCERAVEFRRILPAEATTREADERWKRLPFARET